MIFRQSIFVRKLRIPNDLRILQLDFKSFSRLLKEHRATCSHLTETPNETTRNEGKQN